MLMTWSEENDLRAAIKGRIHSFCLCVCASAAANAKGISTFTITFAIVRWWMTLIILWCFVSAVLACCMWCLLWWAKRFSIAAAVVVASFHCLICVAHNNLQSYIHIMCVNKCSFAYARVNLRALCTESKKHVTHCIPSTQSTQPI